jgi:hypothetical protein
MRRGRLRYAYAKRRHAGVKGCHVICVQAMVVGYKAHVGGRTTFRVLNHAESRVYSNGGHRGHHRERVPLVSPSSSPL